jgi:peptidyl-prolyl cis-trans isomerase SurA
MLRTYSPRRLTRTTLLACMAMMIGTAANGATETTNPPTVTAQEKTPAAKTKLTLSERDAAGIAVVVNDAAITNGDIIARYGMALLSSGLQDSPDNRARIMPQVVRGLVEEQLQLQETRRQQIDVSESEINQALTRIAQENHVPGGDVRKFFQSQGVSPRTIEQQTRTNIAWAKLVQRQLRPRVEVSDDEVEDVVARLKANEGKTEYFVNEVFLPVDDEDQDKAVHGFANKLQDQIRQTGAFGAIARQFSQGAGASNGGEIGWIQQGTLAPEIDTALTQSKVGGLLGPIKTSKGYHLLAVRDQRKITLGGDAGTIIKLAQIAHGVAPQDLKAAVEATKAKTASVKSCAKLDSEFPATEGWQIRMFPEQPIAALPPAIAPLARSLKVGTPSSLDIQPNGFAFFVVCERTENSSVDRAAIYTAIGSERLENLARGLLRDLKRNAYIDMRI